MYMLAELYYYIQKRLLVPSSFRWHQTYHQYSTQYVTIILLTIDKVCKYTLALLALKIQLLYYVTGKKLVTLPK